MAKSPAEVYLEHTTKCLEQVDVMMSRFRSPKINREQCEYLTQKLRVSVQNAHLFFQEIKMWYSMCAPPVDMAKSLEIFKLLFAVSKAVESFIQSCCKERWILPALMLINATWKHTFSLVSDLDFCTYVFSAKKDLQGGAIPSFSNEEIVGWSEAEAATVKEMVERDDLVLLQSLSEIKCSSRAATLTKRLATFLYQRWTSARLGVNSCESLESLFHSTMHDDVLDNDDDVLDNDDDHLAYFFDHLACDDDDLAYVDDDLASDDDDLTNNLSATLLKKVGSGGFGTVHKARWLGAEVANKSFHGAGDPDFLREVSILAGLNHPNIVSLFWCTSEEHKCNIIMELMDGDLNSLMDEKLNSKSKSERGKPPFTTFETLDISLQVAEALLFLYDRKIVHRDIKSHNILTKSVKTTLKTSTDGDIVNEHVLVKVADFGLSKTKERSITCTDQTPNVGTARWMAPEVIRFRDRDGVSEEDACQSITSKYPFQSDVYSFGMVCYEILTGRVPFSTVGSPNDVKKMVLRGVRPQLPEHCPSNLKTLIEACWSPMPSERPRFPEICAQLRELRYAYLTTATWAAWSKIPRHFSLDEIKIMTNNLSDANSLKTVSYRKIWKGVMVGTGEVVAVDEILFGLFKHKLKVLSEIDHNNVVRCVGFCYEQGILLYADMPTSTLSDWHEGDKNDVSHNWQARKTISFGVARGIHHLHTVPKIVHQAIQPDDILLNVNLEPQLTGFGWSVKSSSYVHEEIASYRRPWSAPEFYTHGKLSEKVDVYNYGLVLLEIVSGTRVGLPGHTVYTRPVSFDTDHLERAWILHSEGRTAELIDCTLTLQPHEGVEAVRMLHIAFLCLHSEPETRPDMNLVVEMLHGHQDEQIIRLGTQHGQDRDAGMNLT